MWKREPEPQRRRLGGFRSKVYVKRIPDASTSGVQFLLDLRSLEDNYGLEGTYSFSWRFLDFEQWFTFASETGLTLSLSVVAVLFIVLTITADIVVTLLVAFCVGMVDLFLIGVIHFWGLTLNPLVTLNIVVAVGISVDYSAHISYAYLIQPVPETSEYDTPAKVRLHKTKMALQTMGSSVFHGGFSTFIAILVLSGGNTYVFKVFYRLWFGIILFGMANGFILLTTMLSLVGPTHTVVDPMHKLEDGHYDSKVASETTSRADA